MACEISKTMKTRDLPQFCNTDDCTSSHGNKFAPPSSFNRCICLLVGSRSRSSIPWAQQRAATTVSPRTARLGLAFRTLRPRFLFDLGVPGSIATFRSPPSRKLTPTFVRIGPRIKLDGLNPSSLTRSVVLSQRGALRDRPAIFGRNHGCCTGRDASARSGRHARRCS